MARIELDRVSLRFKLRHLRRVTLKEFLVRRLFRKSVNPIQDVRALQEISLEVREGQRLGVIGHNGAGKSTLLKMLAGVYPPTSGRRIVEGHVSSLFDIALGFELEANGWENIRYRGYLQGETPRSLQAKMKAIADFSELGHFLDMPVRYYSSGMLVRLAFSIATAIDPQVLLVDEVLSVGDLAFQEKARQRMLDVMARAQAIVMVSHDLEAIQNICDRTVWLDHGRVRLLGPTADVIAAYTESVRGTPTAPLAA
jgi:ABC-type polysaccharide/polyol phosphate transport system ATPase subunit